jgi:hypothetical protein
VVPAQCERLHRTLFVRTDQGNILRWIWSYAPDHDSEVRLPKPMILATQPGDVVVIPAGHYHASYSSTMWMETGLMEVDTATLVQMARDLLSDLKNGGGINAEAELEELESRLGFWRRLWSEKHPAFEWGSDAELIEFCHILKVSSDWASCT